MKSDPFRFLLNPNEVIINISNQREYDRFEESFGTPVKIALKTGNNKQTNDYNGLILNDSLGGCSLIVLTKDTPEVSEYCWLKLSDLQSIPAKIIWVNQLEQHLFRLGVKYLI